MKMEAMNKELESSDSELTQLRAEINNKEFDSVTTLAAENDHLKKEIVDLILKDEKNNKDEATMQRIMEAHKT